METRYIPRFRLPDRLYVAGSPVVLAAGALLEDTQMPRLVVQLKFKSVSAKPISALTVEVHSCPDECGAGGTIEFHYTGLAVQRGQAFGQYAAIVLPPESTRAFTAQVCSVAFADGTVWNPPVGACWAPLPAFRSLEAVLNDQELLELSAANLPGGRYVYTAQAGLWYCTCGGVNGDDETSCHRCGRSRELSARYADPIQLEALRQNRREEAARQAAEQERLREEAQARAAARKAARAESAAQIREKFRGKRFLLLGIAAAAILVAAILLVPRLLGGEPGADGSVGGFVENQNNQSEEPIQVTTSTDGETVSFDLYEDEDGICTVTAELVREVFPEVECINFGGTPNLGNDIDSYLIDSFQMAILVSTQGEYGSEGEWGSFSPKNDPDSPRSLLLFDANTHLMGYAIGVPEDVGGGAWRMQVTLCDYDFTELYEEQLAEFTADQDRLFQNYIAPEDLADSGAEWFLYGYNTGRGPTLRPDDSQLYHLWSQATSPYLEKFCRELERDQLEHWLPREDRWMCYLFFDADYEPLGYTMLNSEGSGGPSSAAPEILGTADLYLEEDSNGQCLFTEELLRTEVPEMKFFTLDMGIDLGNNVDAYLADSFHMAWLVASGGEQQGGYLTASYTLRYENLFVLLLYSDLTRLCGYYIGVPEAAGEGRWHIPITICNYDFTRIYEEQAIGYEASQQYPYIPQEDIADSGAVWYIPPVSQLSGDDAFTRSVKLQSLWSRMTSPYLREFIRPIENLFNYAGYTDSETPYYCMLLDTNRQYLGYTVITDGSLTEGLSAPGVSGAETDQTTVQLDLMADENGYCTLTLDQVQALVPEAEGMEFRGMPDLGDLDAYLAVSDQVAWWVASDGTREINQTSSRFSVQGGRAPSRVLLLYRDSTTLCGYFTGEPEPVGGDTWRLEITLCDYDFSGLCQRQAQAFAQRERLPELTLEEGSAQGATQLIDAYSLSNNDAFCQTVQQYGLWSRAESSRSKRFYKNFDDLEELRPNERTDGETVWAYYLLLDDTDEPLGYLVLTN